MKQYIKEKGFYIQDGSNYMGWTGEKYEIFSDETDYLVEVRQLNRENNEDNED